jgi:alpha-1,2-mannosyltransferase
VVRARTVAAALPAVAVLAWGTRVTAYVALGEWAKPAAARWSDFQVYWAATGALLRGADLYHARPPGRLQFTYPPFAGGLLALLRPAPEAVVQGCWLTAVVVLGVAVPALVVRRYRPGSFPWVAFGFGVLTFLASDSLRTCLRWGQVGMFLLTVVVIDALYLPARRQGAGVGAAAAFRVAPAFIAVVALLRGRRRLAVVAAGAAVTLTLLTAAALPAASWEYWTGLLWETDRVGPLGNGNLSLAGVLTRAGLGRDGVDVVWVCFVLAVLVALWWLPRPRLTDSGQLLRLLTAGALLTEVVSPITWRHHWVWLPLAALLLYLDGRPVSAFAVASLSALPLESFAGPESAWGWWQEVLLALPLLCALLVAAALLALPAMAAPAVHDERGHDDGRQRQRHCAADEPLHGGVGAAREEPEQHEGRAPDEAARGVEG